MSLKQRTANELMNPELFSVGPNTLVKEVRDRLTELEISSCPIVGDDDRLVGMALLTKLAAAPGSVPVSTVATPRGMTVGEDASVAEIHELMAETYSHHVVVVSATGSVVGVVSSLDVLRELADLPPRRPDPFPHHDEEFDVRWTDQIPLEYGRVFAAPDRAGVVSLIHRGSDSADHIVWSEFCEDMRGRLAEMLAEPSKQCPELSAVLALGSLRYRFSSLDDRGRAREVVDALQRLSGHASR